MKNKTKTKEKEQKRKKMHPEQESLEQTIEKCGGREQKASQGFNWYM